MSAEFETAHVIWDDDDGDWYDDCDHDWLDRPESDTHVCRACGYEGTGPPPLEGCDCTELCSMGPTCPGGMLAGLPDSGCWRTTVTSPGAPEAEHDSSLCPEEESRYMECSCPCEQCKHICTAGGES
jgi:hypothetical protein